MKTVLLIGSKASLVFLCKTERIEPMQNNTLMLLKDDFKSDRDWQAVCRVPGLPESKVEVELRCSVRVAKSNYTHAKFHIIPSLILLKISDELTLSIIFQFFAI